MERFILRKPPDWKNSVGVTMKAYFNFDKNGEYKQFFETAKDVDRIPHLPMTRDLRQKNPEPTSNVIKLTLRNG